jgi:plasmid rolling circle replication initiator protein Rep
MWDTHLQAAVDDCLGVSIRHSDSLQDEVNVVRNETITTETDYKHL